MLLRISIEITVTAAIFLLSANVQGDLEHIGLPESVYEENADHAHHDYDRDPFFVPRNDSERTYVRGIFDGWNVESPQQFPYHAFIGCVLNVPIEITWRCNGAIINDRFVITLAECIHNCNVIKIRVGTIVHPAMNSTVAPQEYFNKIGSKPYYTHPQYNPANDDHHLALIETQEPIIFSQSVGPVIIPNNPELAPNVSIVATGFGNLHKHNIDWGLQFLTLNVANESECGDFFPNISVTTMCAKSKDYNNVGRGTLCAEFGAPAVLKRDNRTLVGIYITSIQTCLEGAPEAFIAIENYTSWIREIAIDPLIT